MCVLVKLENTYRKASAMLLSWVRMPESEFSNGTKCMTVHHGRIVFLQWLNMPLTLVVLGPGRVCAGISM